MPSDLPSLDDLRLLVTVAESGSIGKSAATLGMTQPNASRRLAGLEQSTGVELLLRGSRGSTLTTTGRIVADWAAALLRAADDFSASVAALGRSDESPLRLAVSMTIAEHYLADWVAKARAAGSDFRLSLRVANSADVVELVRGDRVDVAFVESPSVPAGLHKLKVGRDDLAVAVAPEHRWARRQDIELHELAAAHLLLREHGSGTRDAVDRAVTRHGLELKALMELPSNTALKSAAAAGIGPVVISRQALESELDAGTLVEVLVRETKISRPLWLVWARDSAISRRAVVELLHAVGAATSAVPRSPHRDKTDSPAHSRTVPKST